MNPAVPSSTFTSRQVDALDAAFQAAGSYQASDATLTALAGLDTSAGFVRQTGTDTFTKSAAAVQADQETATSVVNPVVPAVQQLHPSAAKCWACVTVSAGTPTLATSYNVTSITDSGTGDLTITIATDFSSANWAAIASVLAAATLERHLVVLAIAVGSVELGLCNGAPADIDPGTWFFAGFGDQ